MKLTTKQLKQLIKEEYRNLLESYYHDRTHYKKIMKSRSPEISPSDDPNRLPDPYLIDTIESVIDNLELDPADHDPAVDPPLDHYTIKQLVDITYDVLEDGPWLDAKEAKMRAMAKRAGNKFDYMDVIKQTYDELGRIWKLFKELF